MLRIVAIYVIFKINKVQFNKKYNYFQFQMLKSI